LKSIQYITNSYSNDYRFGFNGKEKDKETYGEGNEYDYGFRIYNPRIGRFLSVDPLTQSYPWYTPYQFAGNQPIWAIDLDGLEEYIIHNYIYKTSRGNTVVSKVDFVKTPVSMQASDAKNIGTYYEPKSEMRFKNEISDRNKISKNDVKEFKDQNLYNEIKKGNDPKGSVYYNYALHFDNFGDDIGRTKEQVAEKFNSSKDTYKDHIDGMVAILINDPNTTLDITGIASPYETNIDGTLNTLSVENNQELANQRASALKSFVQDYAKKNYGKELSDDRFKTNGIISPDNKDKNKRGKDQAVSAKIKHN